LTAVSRQGESRPRLPTLPRFLGNQVQQGQYIVGTVKGRLTVQPQRLRLAASASSAALNFLKTASMASSPLNH
jgi:hypothetical protein